MRGFAGALLGMWLALAASGFARAEGEVERWLDDLASPDFETRERATESLLDVGLEGKDAILAARESLDLERRRRVERVLAEGLLGALLEDRAEDLGGALWDRHSEAIFEAFRSRIPLVDLPGSRVDLVRPGSEVWLGDLRVAKFRATGKAWFEDMGSRPSLGKDECALVLEGHGGWPHVFSVVVLSPAALRVLSNCDGSRAIAEVAPGREGLRVLLQLRAIDYARWSAEGPVAPAANGGRVTLLEHAAHLPPVESEAPPRLFFVADCFVGE